jgi:hypothetical protein
VVAGGSNVGGRISGSTFLNSINSPIALVDELAGCLHVGCPKLSPAVVLIQTANAVVFTSILLRNTRFPKVVALKTENVTAVVPV